MDFGEAIFSLSHTRFYEWKIAANKRKPNFNWLQTMMSIEVNTVSIHEATQTPVDRVVCKRETDVFDWLFGLLLPISKW